MRPDQPFVGLLIQKLMLLGVVVGFLVAGFPSSVAACSVSALGDDHHPLHIANVHIANVDQTGFKSPTLTKERLAGGLGTWITALSLSLAALRVCWFSRTGAAWAGLPESLVSWNIRLQI